MGGPTARKKAYPIRLHKVRSDKMGRYGEPLGEQVEGVEGVEGDGFTVVSRSHVWEIQKARQRTATPGVRRQDAGAGPGNGRRPGEGTHPLQTGVGVAPCPGVFASTIRPGGGNTLRRAAPSAPLEFYQ